MRVGALRTVKVAALVAALALGTVAPAAAQDQGTAAIQQKYAELGGGGPLGDWADLPGGGKVARFAKWGTTVAITWASGWGAHWFSGNINAKWQPSFGAAVADQGPTVGRPGAAAGYANGVSIYYSDATGAHALSGPVRQKYWEMGHTAGALGFPETDVLPVEGGTFAQFQGMVSIFAKNGAAPHWISGALRQKFWDGGSLGVLGFPASDQQITSGRSGYVIDFDGGKGIYWSAETGATLLDGPANQKYAALGGTASVFGFPITDTVAVAGGTRTRFQGTVEILWSAETGAHWLSGALAALFWNSIGGTDKLGFPTTDQLPTSGASGLYVLFGPSAAILWGAGTGAQFVHDAFLDRLRADGDVARYGLPQTGVLDLAGRDGWAFQQFGTASIFQGPEGTAFTVGWQVRSTWWQLGGYTGALGLPLDNQADLGNRIEQRFEGGVAGCYYGSQNACYWSPFA
ncbi:LGFP repeat-containing protein [Actinokineospora sp. HUAS TT18]|uniref:LGFP repeat-containing protein n=1 Tax=Actinokineospora sp. HUAS TT18 TaxID=3447451 RepID=UPI003F51E5D9